MARPTVGSSCEECGGEFYARWDVGTGVIINYVHLCKKCYMRYYMAQKRRESTCNKRACKEPATCHEKRRDRHLCIVHHDEIWHTEGSPFYRERGPSCACWRLAQSVRES